MAESSGLRVGAVLQYMTYHGVECEILPLPTCEPNKSFNLIFQVAERLEAFKLNRSDQGRLDTHGSLHSHSQMSLCVRFVSCGYMFTRIVSALCQHAWGNVL